MKAPAPARTPYAPARVTESVRRAGPGAEACDLARLGDRDRARERREPDHRAAGQRERLRAVAVAEADHERRDRTPDQAADVPAPGDARQREADHQVEQDQATDAALHDRDLPRPHLHGGRAHQTEDRPRRADRRRVRRHEQRAEGAAQQRDRVDRPELQPPQRRLEHLAEDVEHVHVEADVEQVLVHEAARHDPPPLTVRHAQRGQAAEAAEQGAFFVDLSRRPAGQGEAALRQEHRRR